MENNHKTIPLTNGKEMLVDADIHRYVIPQDEIDALHIFTMTGEGL